MDPLRISNILLFHDAWAFHSKAGHTSHIYAEYQNKDNCCYWDNKRLSCLPNCVCFPIAFVKPPNITYQSITNAFCFNFALSYVFK